MRPRMEPGKVWKSRRGCGVDSTNLEPDPMFPLIGVNCVVILGKSVSVVSFHHIWSKLIIGHLETIMLSHLNGIAQSSLIVVSDQAHVFLRVSPITITSLTRVTWRYVPLIISNSGVPLFHFTQSNRRLSYSLLNHLYHRSTQLQDVFSFFHCMSSHSSFPLVPTNPIILF